MLKVSAFWGELYNSEWGLPGRLVGKHDILSNNVKYFLSKFVVDSNSKFRLLH